ncbi:ferritin family protein [Archaeoglobus sp.]
MTPEEILKKAIEMEREAIEVYSEMKRDADPQTAELLEYLISQEREHIKLLNDRLKAVRLLKKE